MSLKVTRFLSRLETKAVVGNWPVTLELGEWMYLRVIRLVACQRTGKTLMPHDYPNIRRNCGPNGLEFCTV